MSDLNFQDFSTVQSNQQLGTTTIASAATIAPKSLITIVTGVVQLVTITPPVSGDHLLFLVFPDAMGVFSVAGNIKTAADPGVNIPVGMLYNSKEGKYYPSAIS